MVVSLGRKDCIFGLSSIPLPSNRWTDVRGLRKLPLVVLTELIEAVIIIIKERIFACLFLD